MIVTAAQNWNNSILQIPYYSTFTQRLVAEPPQKTISFCPMDFLKPSGKSHAGPWGRLDGTFPCKATGRIIVKDEYAPVR
jgi:hypothetical protein